MKNIDRIKKIDHVVEAQTRYSDGLHGFCGHYVVVYGAKNYDDDGTIVYIGSIKSCAYVAKFLTR